MRLLASVAVGLAVVLVSVLALWVEGAAVPLEPVAAWGDISPGLSCLATGFLTFGLCRRSGLPRADGTGIVKLFVIATAAVVVAVFMASFHVLTVDTH